jgi:hypothetical protein
VFTLFDDIERWLAPRAGKLLAEPIGAPAGLPGNSAFPLGPPQSGMLPSGGLPGVDGTVESP